MILRELRQATAAVHARVEDAMPSLGALATPEGYATALRALHGFFAAWEPPVWRGLAPLTEPLTLRERRKLPLLEADMRALGLDAELDTAPAPPALSIEAALGAMYVMEGSTLGGQVISRHTEPALGVSAAHGGAFYHGYGVRTGERWKAFGEALTEYVDAHGGAADVVAGAVSCFTALECWLARDEAVASSPVVTRV